MNRRAFLETAGFLALAGRGVAAATPKLTLAEVDVFCQSPFEDG
jgi:hypothetical protein